MPTVTAAEGGSATGTKWVETRHAAEHPAVHRTPSVTKRRPAQNVSQAEAEKPCSSYWGFTLETWGRLSRKFRLKRKKILLHLKKINVKEYFKTNYSYDKVSVEYRTFNFYPHKYRCVIIIYVLVCVLVSTKKCHFYSLYIILIENISLFQRNEIQQFPVFSFLFSFFFFLSNLGKSNYSSVKSGFGELAMGYSRLILQQKLFSKK